MSGLLKLVLILVLVNVVVFLWPTKANVGANVYNGSAEINPQFIRLNKEIEARFYSKVEQAEVIKKSKPEVDEEFDRTVNVESTKNVVNANTGAVCYRLGPFMYQDSYELAQAVLFNAGVDFKTSSRASKESDVFRLFLGPYEDLKAASRVRAQLKEKKIFDHFTRKVSQDVYIVSLGIYSTEESANSALRQFINKIDGVKVQNETVVLPDNYWLHFELLKSSSKSVHLRSVDWGETSVKMGPHTCRS